MTPLWIVLGLAVLIALGFVISYNRFVRQRNLVQESWRQVDVELTRRHDLIPNLVETVKGYAAHERTVLEAVTEARTQAQAATTGGAGPAGQAQAENVLVRSLGGLFAVAENYDRRGTAWSRYLKCPDCDKRHDPKNRLLQMGYQRGKYWSVDQC